VRMRFVCRKTRVDVPMSRLRASLANRSGIGVLYNRMIICVYVGCTMVTSSREISATPTYLYSFYHNPSEVVRSVVFYLPLH